MLTLWWAWPTSIPLRLYSDRPRGIQKAKLNVPAVTALAYLRDILEVTPQPQRAVRHVREYLDGLRLQPERLFLPLPEK